MYNIVLVFMFVMFAGCSITVPHIAEYRIAPEIKSAEYSAKECKAKSLKVMQSFSASSLKSKEMRYTQKNFKEFSFTESKWAQNPNQALNTQLIKSLRFSKLFESVSVYKSRGKSDLILESSIEEFVQHFDDNNTKSFVNVVIYLNLIESKTSKILSSTRVSNKLKVSRLDAEGGVDALNEALANTLVEVNEWLNGVCK